MLYRNDSYMRHRHADNMISNSSASMLYRLLTLALATFSALAETKQFTRSDNYTYAYDYIPAQDNKPTVFLVHGFPSWRGDWRNQIDALSVAGSAY